MNITPYSIKHLRSMKAGEQALYTVNSANAISQIGLASRRSGGKVKVEQALLVKTAADTIPLVIVTVIEALQDAYQSKDEAVA